MQNDCYWCHECRVPLINHICEKCGKEGKHLTKQGLKPVFDLERNIYNNLIKNEFNCELPNTLYRSRNRIYYDGHLLFSFEIKDNKIVLRGNDGIRSRIEQINDGIGPKFHFVDTIKANKNSLTGLEKEAVDFIRNTKEEFSDRKTFISFSGGKDSTITAFLTKKSIGNVPMLFVNTSIEYPETVEYSSDFAKKIGLKLITLSPPKNFFDLEKEFGPPSRTMRWCCFTQKSAPISDFYRNFSEGILSYDGIRKAESSARTKYNRIHNNTKIVKQISAYPILYWSDIAIWLYIMYRNIPINPLYKNGFSRVGCWLCPNNARISNFLMCQTHYDLYKKWHTILSNFAIGNNRDDTWVSDGEWKKRNTKYKYFKVMSKEKSPCKMENSFVYKLKKRTADEDFVNFLKIFGSYRRMKMDNKDIVQISSQHVNIFTFLGSNSINVEFFESKGIDIKHSLEKQIEKALNCVKCGACMGTCSRGAIGVDDNFRIDENLCTNCLTCTKSEYLKQACTALHYKQDRKIIKNLT